MGITQLLPFLEKSTRNCHVSEFRGQTVAIDSYCWLHKGARGCAMKLAKGEPTAIYVQYCQTYITMLQSYDIKPIMVFDGRHLPAKAGTEAKRRETKDKARRQGMDFLRLGKLNEAYKSFCQCIDVTPEMALEVIKVCRELQIDYIVAPYESDAELAYLSIQNFADCIISEDSDLLLFGCKRVLYKMDLNGAGQLVESDKIHISMNLRRELYNFEKFRHMCILSGCDYLDSLPGIGLKDALKFVTMTAGADPHVLIDRLPRYLNMKNLTVPEGYKEKFLLANATFAHQIVFDPVTRRLVNLNQVTDHPHYCRNVGEVFDNGQAFQIAIGNINPLNMRQIDDWDPSDMLNSEFSIWSPLYKPRPKPSPRYQPPQNLLSKNIDLKVLEKANEHDKMVEKELEFYKSPVKIHVELIEHNSPESAPTATTDTSPVLGNNPFIKKKISRFRVTQQISQQKVISRFFFSNVVGAQEQPCSSSSHSSLLTSEGSYDLQNDTPGTSGFGSPSLTSNGSNENSDSGSDSMTVHTGCMSQTEETTDTSDDPPQIECECILEVEDTVLAIPMESTASTSAATPSTSTNAVMPSTSKRVSRRSTASTSAATPSTSTNAMKPSTSKRVAKRSTASTSPATPSTSKRVATRSTASTSAATPSTSTNVVMPSTSKRVAKRSTAWTSAGTPATSTSDVMPSTSYSVATQSAASTITAAPSTSTHSTTLTSVENLPTEPPAKRRKTQAQAKGKKRPAKQTTVQEMFKKMRME